MKQHKSKPGSFKGGRPPLAKRSKALDADRDKKALLRAKKAGFATVAEHRAHLASKQAKLDASLRAKGTGKCPRDSAIVQTARAIVAQRHVDMSSVLTNAERDYTVTVNSDGVIKRDPLPPTPTPARPANPASMSERIEAYQRDLAADPTVKGVRRCVPPRVVDGKIVRGYWEIVPPNQAKQAREAAAGKRVPCAPVGAGYGGDGSSLDALTLRDQMHGTRNWTQDL